MKKLKIIDLGMMDYGQALDLQLKLHKERIEGKEADILLIVEHPPVITLGVRGKQDNILIDIESLKANGVNVYEVSRGGDVTYHGPGQIVGYPVIDLNGYDRDIKAFISRIENVFILMLEDKFGMKARAESGTYTGVWVGNNKITAIGIAVKKWVTMHGFAFNVNTNLEHFKWINPCGITDRGVTSIEKLIGKKQDMKMMKELTVDYFLKVFEAISCQENSLNNVKGHSSADEDHPC